MKKFLNPPAVRHTLFRTFSVWMVAVLLVGAFLSAAPIQVVQAATCTTTADGAWSAAIWSCPGGPTATDDVVVQHQVELSANASIASLLISVPGVLKIEGPVTLTLSGNLNVEAGAIFDPESSTVAFAAGDQTITTNNQWVDFYNLTKITAGSLSVDPSTTVGQAGGGIHVLETLTLQGAAPATFLTLRSTVPGSRWQVWYEGAAVVDYVDVKDSANVAGVINAIIATNSGNNSGWTFGAGDPTTVKVSTSANPAVRNQTVILTATVTPLTASGEVSFYAGGSDIFGCEHVMVEGGTATCTTTFQTVEIETITAVFSAEQPYGSSISNAIPLPVTTGSMKFFLPISVME